MKGRGGEREKGDGRGGRGREEVCVMAVGGGRPWC